MMLVGKFDFRDDQTEVLTRKNIDFPGECSIWNYVTDFFNDDALPKLNERLGLHDRNRVLQLEPAKG